MIALLPHSAIEDWGAITALHAFAEPSGIVDLNVIVSHPRPVRHSVGVATHDRVPGSAPVPGAGSITLEGEEAGDGPPVVLLHGLSATRRNVVQGSRALDQARLPADLL